MSHWMKISVPIGCGLAAAIVNFIALQGGLETTEYVVLADDVEAGEELTASHLQSKTLNKHHMPRGAVQASDKIAFLGLPVTRELVRGDVLLSHDVSQPELGEPVPESMWSVDLSPIRYGQSIEMFRVGGVVRIIVEVANGQLKEIGPFEIYAVGSNRSPIPQTQDSKAKTITVLGKRNSPEMVSLINASSSRRPEAVIKQIIPAG